MIKKLTDTPATAVARKLDESLAMIRSQVKLRPRIAVVLGSGLGDFADTLASPTSINTSDIPHYPRSSVVGHQGRLVFGTLGTTSLLAFQGRVHFYETGSLETVLYPIRIAHLLGITTLIVTNAAGGVNRSFRPGDLMLITDQLNLTFEDPLRSALWPRRSIRNDLYDLDLQRVITAAAGRLHLKLRKGVYCGVKGPSYETAAEVRMVGRVGGDAVGMSTINEVSLAATLGMREAGISCITNFAT
jgi:purine-nucleoside phosphorylase